MKKDYQKAELRVLIIESEVILTSGYDSVDASGGDFAPGDIWGSVEVYDND